MMVITDHMDRLQSLEVFIAVAEAESFAEGARRMGLSAPSATRGVNALEGRLGVRLFTRTTRRVRLTEVGQSYLEDARHIVAQMQAAAASEMIPIVKMAMVLFGPQKTSSEFTAPEKISA